MADSDLGARRAVVALMLAGIALDAIVAPAVGTATAAVRAGLPLAAGAAMWATVLFTAGYYSAIVLSLWAATVLGKRRYLAVSFLGFATASAICAVAPDDTVFVAGRALQGIALGGVFANALLTFAATAPPRDLGVVFAVFAFLALATPTLAPLATGVVLAALGWRAVFGMLALAALAVGVPALRLMRDPRPAARAPFDAVAATALVLACAAFAWFVQRAETTGFGDPYATFAVLVATVAAAIFAIREARATSGFVDLAVAKTTVVARGLAIATLLGVLIAGGEVQLQYAREALHLEPAHASAILALRVAGIALGGVTVALCTARGIAGRTLIIAGFAAIALAFVAQGAVTANTLGETALLPVMLLHGLGFALVMGPLGSLLFAAVSRASMASLVVFFKLTVGLGNAVAAPIVAAFLAVESVAGRPAAWAYADVWGVAALIAAGTALLAVALRAPAAVAAAVAVAFALCAPGSASAQPAPAATARPPLLPLRDEEDWRALRDPKLRTDAFDGLKYVPLGPDPSQFFTLSGEVRAWYERYVHQDWKPSNPSNGYMLPRYLLGIDVHSFRFHTFVQLESATAAGRNGGPGAIFRDDFDATDAYVAWRFGPLDEHPGRVAVIAGRQELDYGAGRVISARDGAGVRSSFDGLRTVLRSPAWRLDAFVVQPVKIASGAFDDAPDATQTLFGAYASRTLGRDATLEAYVVGDWRSSAVYARGVGPETRYTVGVRAARSYGRIAAELEASRQFGTFGRAGTTAAIDAASIAGNLTYTFGGRDVVPALTLGAGTGSGDTDPRSATLRTYVPPSFRGSYLGAVQENGPANSLAYEPALAVTYRGRTTLTFSDVIMRVATSTDAVYAISGFPLRAPAPGAPRDLGGGPLVQLAHRVDRHLSLTATYQRLNAGTHIRAAPPAASISYDRFVFDYKF